MEKKKIELLDILDPEFNLIYTLQLSPEDCLRAKQDEQFADSLLFHARNTRNCTNSLTKPLLADSNSENLLENNDNFLNDTENEQSCTNDANSNTRAVWSYNQTLYFIRVMATHLEDLHHPTKRKHVFEWAANDMISEGYSVSIDILKNKWKGLNRSYTKAKDNKHLTGRSPSRFMFFDEMDEILGDKPTNQCTHSLNSNDDCSISVNSTHEENPETFTDTPNNIPDEVENNLNQTNSDNEASTSNAKKKGTKRLRLSEKGLKQRYIEKKEDEYKKRQQRHDERIQLEQEKLEIERQKLEVLKSFLGQNSGE